MNTNTSANLIPEPINQHLPARQFIQLHNSLRTQHLQTFRLNLHRPPALKKLILSKNPGDMTPSLLANPKSKIQILPRTNPATSCPKRATARPRRATNGQQTGKLPVGATNESSATPSHDTHYDN